MCTWINNLKYLPAEETRAVCCCFSGALKPQQSEQELRYPKYPSNPTRPSQLHQGSENCPPFNGCFEVKRIIISLEVLKFPRRNPTVLLVLRLLSFYTFDRLPGASITPKLMANGEKVKGKTWLIIAITPADTNYQWL